MKSYSRLRLFLATSVFSLPLAATPVGTVGQRIAALTSSAVSAEVTVLPVQTTYPVTLREVDLKRRGCTLNVGQGRALAELLTLLSAAQLRSASQARGENDPRIRIALAAADGTVTKLLFEGLSHEDDDLYTAWSMTNTRRPHRHFQRM